MGNRRTTTKAVITNTAVSGTTVYTSSWFPMGTYVAVGGQITFTGTMTGTLTIEVSYDPPVSMESSATPSPTNFNAVSISVNSAIVASIAIGAAGTFSWELGSGNGGAMSANWVRMKYTNATLSGTIVVGNIVGKAAG